MTFRSKTALTIAVLTALALGGAFAAVSAAFNGLQREQLDASLLSVAMQEAMEAPSHHFSFSDRPGPAANDVGPLTKYGIIFEEDGRVLSATPPFDVSPLALRELNSRIGEAFDLWFHREHLRGVLVNVPGHPDKVLFLATSRDDLDGDEVFLFHAMLVALLVALSWVAAVAYWMGGRLTLAHRDIARAVRQVTQGDLSARVELEASDPEVDQLGREINEMVGQLDLLLTSQQRFIAHAAHELRTPLAALYGELQQAQRKERDNAYYARTIDTALSATRDLKLLADDLLTLARARAQVRDEPARVPLQRVIDDVRTLLEPLAQERAIRVSTDGDLAQLVPDRNGDTSRLVRNVVENAIRHAHDAGEVRLSITHDAGRVKLHIADDGPGVAERDRAAIFEPFFRAHHARSPSGAGLGLSIAREIARSHGGDVQLDVSAKETPGACFVVTLPSMSPGRESP